MTVNSMTWPLPAVHLVNLVRRPDRRQRALARMVNLDIPVQVFEAVDTSEFDGKAGCRASHLELWREAVFHDETLVVMEDDVVFAPDFLAGLARTLADLPSDWELLFLGGQHLGVQPTLVQGACARVPAVMQTHAYVARPGALHTSLHWMAELPGELDVVWAGRMSALKVYRAWPWLCGQEDGYSDVTRSRVTGRSFEAAACR